MQLEKSSSKLSWQDVPAELVLPGIERRVVHGDQQTMVRYVYAPGAVFPMHAHPQEQITLVIRGRIRFDVRGESIELAPGDVAIIPGNSPHGAQVVGDEEVETYNSLSPRREENPYRDSGVILSGREGSRLPMNGSQWGRHASLRSASQCSGVSVRNGDQSDPGGR